VNKTDLELVAESVAGQTQAFDELVLRYQDRLFNALVRILRNREDARDVAQESFVTAWRKLESFRGESSFYSWLFRVAYNVAMSRGRKKRITTVSPAQSNTLNQILADSQQGASPSYQMELNEQQQTVRQALDHLPEEYRVVLVLKELEDFKYEQIAEILDVPLGTIRSRIHRARQLLRESLIRLLPEGDELARTKTV
jgi:RNA polymerase sigma-70 factor (ECF subfamily)